MAMSLLGETIDIHTGGIDLQFPHHEDEIAQSEAATGKPFARFWCHGEFLLTDGSKMAKRVGNVATVQDLRAQSVSAAAVRHLMFSTHYRKQLNLSGAALEASMEAVRRVGDFAERLASAVGGTAKLAEVAETFRAEFDDALRDDLNAPRAQAALFVFINHANAELDKRGSDAAGLAAAREAFARADAVLDIVPDQEGVDASLATWVEQQIEARKAARGRRDFAAADQIRKSLEEKGIVVEDTPQGARWKKVR
jgi:cysteinyl-tRNA synthetase